MPREILQVQRCARCQTALSVQVQDDDLDDSGYPVRTRFWLPRRAHTEAQCRQLLILAQEEWPRLFEAEA